MIITDHEIITDSIIIGGGGESWWLLWLVFHIKAQHLDIETGSYHTITLHNICKTDQAKYLWPSLRNSSSTAQKVTVKNCAMIFKMLTNS